MVLIGVPVVGDVLCGGEEQPGSTEARMAAASPRVTRQHLSDISMRSPFNMGAVSPSVDIIIATKRGKRCTTRDSTLVLWRNGAMFASDGLDIEDVARNMFDDR